MADVSIVVEWETALTARRGRGAQAVAALRRELRETAAELIVCFDPREVQRETIAAALVDVPARLVEVPEGLDYYGKKNFGFDVSTGEVIVFLDSDVILEPGSLAALIAPFQDFRKSVVIGRTHLDTATVWQRAVALFWIFEAPEPAALRPTQRLLSNSFAIRRAVFQRFRFPQRPTFRGPCSELASTLTAHGIAMWEQTAARASHPAPANVAEFFKRAFHAGTDQWFYDDATLARCAANWREDMRHVAERIERRRHVIGAGIASIVLAWVCGFSYYAAKAIGYSARLIETNAPGIVRREAIGRTPQPG